MNTLDKYHYYEWDKSDFILPDKFTLSESNDLADALNVFWSVGGWDFFNVSDPRYYATNWLNFISDLYVRISEGEFEAQDRNFTVPLSLEQKKTLADRGVPPVFITDIVQISADMLQ